MNVSGSLSTFPYELKALIFTFLIVLSIGFFGGLSFVNYSTSMNPNGIETNYLGNENDEQAEIMKFKKSEYEILTLVHNHILSMSVIFFLLSLILITTSLPKKLKYFLIIEPFLSLVLTFGGIYILWLGVNWFKFVVMISGIAMTLSFVIATLSVLYEIIFIKK